MNAVVACTFASDADADAAVGAVLLLGIPPGSVRVGAQAHERAAAIAASRGIAATMDTRDPLAGVPQFAGERSSAGAIDRGGVIGGALGAILGAWLGFTPAGAMLPVAAQMRPLAEALLLFILGAIVGASLGGALGPRRSTHVAYRIVDDMDAGAIGVLVQLGEDRADEIMSELRSAGGRDVIVVTSD